MKLQGDRVEEIAFGGRGCSISQASASMMTEQVKGQTLAQAEQLADLFKDLMTGEGDGSQLGEAEELQALQGVKRYPVRVKCALLPWSALREAAELYRKRITT
jgi:nitrogen fixation NifU-like protein